MTPNQDAAREQLLATLPPEISEALLARDGKALKTELDALPQAERVDILQRLREVGLIEGGLDKEAVLASLPPQVSKAAKARDSDALKAALEPLPEAEQESIMRLLRDARLIAGDDPDLEAVLAAVPADVREAIQSGDNEKLKTALDAMPQAEQPDVLRRLREAGLIAGGPDIEQLLALLPPDIREAMESRDNAKLTAALDALPQTERQDALRLLREAGLLGGGPDMAQVLRDFEPLLQDIALIALAENGADLPDALRESLPEVRERTEAALEQLEQQGWRLRGAIERIWSGERDTATLTAGLDDQDAQLIRRVLELIHS